MLKIADILESRLLEFAEAESMDQGKPVSLAKSVDIPRSVYNFRFFATKILHLQHASSEIDNVALSYTSFSPVGVCGLISPWNLPLYLLTWKIAPCIAAGNTCICKPSEFTSITAFLLCSVLLEAGLPTGVVNMIFGTGPEVGSALSRHPDIPLISFTGGTVTGQNIIIDTSSNYKKLSLELGGKNANIIFDDADIDACLLGSIKSSFANQGEICLCGSRIFVHQGIYEDFLKRFVELTSAVVVGDPKESTTDMGPLVSKQHLEKVLHFIEIAKSEGCRIVYGGTRIEGTSGYFMKPTIITTEGLNPKACTIMQEEIFGPVVSVTPFTTEEQVIEWANGVKYGLSASVWTENGKRQRRVAEALKVTTSFTVLFRLELVG
jgi:acyl-CoA reductase-like NAD-dependent aldehyde dehydrogenase